jgi:hypothetical protein
VSEFRSDHRERRSNGFIAPFRRIGRGLRTFVADVHLGLGDSSIPPATPTLRDYPIRRP